MLTYLLAIVVALGSFTFYMIAFFFPELYRKNDLIWSGVGLFYAYVLWNYAERIRGAVLLGQMAAIALIGWFGWQTLSLRWEQAPVEQRTHVPFYQDSFGKVVQTQTEQLITYLQSDKFKSQLPKNSQEFSQQASRLLKTAKEWTIAVFAAVKSSLTSKSTDPAKSPVDE
jgi:uncharacterized membrane protein